MAVDDGQGAFSSEQFVGREDELGDLIQWATARTVPRRLKTVVGPPGYGKTWLLRQLEKRLRDSHRHGQALFLIRVPTERILIRPSVEDWLVTVLRDWLVTVVKEAGALCHQVRKPEPDSSLETLIAHLLEDLGQNCRPTLRPLLLMDAFDELLDNERREIEKSLLEPFWSNSQVRVVLSFRDELRTLRPASGLRRGEERLNLKVFPPEEGKSQLQKLAMAGARPGPKDLLDLIPPYNWTHPNINACLYRLAQEKAGKSLPLQFTAAELKECWVSLIRSRLDDLTPLSSIEPDLKAVVEIEDSWTLSNFAETCQCDYAGARRRIERLMGLNLVSQANSSHRYQVIEGLRQLLRAEKGL